MRTRFQCVLALAAALVLALCLCPAAALAWDPASVDAYNVDIVVGEDNVYHVTEDIRMSFEPDSYSHGMRREIPLQPHVFFEQDGEQYEATYNVMVGNVDVNEPFETSVEDGYLRIRVGEEDVYVDGQTINYRLTYDYDAGDDHMPELDMFYFGIIGNEWTYPMDNVTFHITMPKEFDADKMGFSVGPHGAQGYDPAFLEYAVDGNEISGRLTGQLPAYEGVWIRIPLPEGYYVGARTIQPGTTPALWVSGAAAVAGVGIFAARRSRSHPVPTVEFEPPADLTSADVGYIQDSIANSKDALSLLLYWADKGYMRIVEMAPKPGKKKSPGLLFIRLSDLPEEANEYEKYMFDALFKSGERVSTVDLKYKFATQLGKTTSLLDRKWHEPANTLYTKSSRALSTAMCLLAAVPCAIMAGVCVYNASFEPGLGWLVGCSTGVGLAAVTIWWSWVCRTRKARGDGIGGGGVAALILFGTALVLCAVGGAATFGWMGILPPTASLLLFLLAPSMLQCTKLGEEYLGQIWGFRRFIERAEAPQIKALADENPEYFYHILPYAYVFDLSEVWAGHFESLAVSEPTWYVGYDTGTFSTIYFTQSLMRGMDRAQSALATSQSSSGSGGGGSSGGSFSGGGFGGGGGGSW